MCLSLSLFFLYRNISKYSLKLPIKKFAGPVCQSDCHFQFVYLDLSPFFLSFFFLLILSNTDFVNRPAVCLSLFIAIDLGHQCNRHLLIYVMERRNLKINAKTRFFFSYFHIFGPGRE